MRSHEMCPVHPRVYGVTPSWLRSTIHDSADSSHPRDAMRWLVRETGRAAVCHQHPAMESANKKLGDRSLHRVLARDAEGFVRVAARAVVATTSTASVYCCAGRRNDDAPPDGTPDHRRSPGPNGMGGLHALVVPKFAEVCRIPH